MKISWWAIRKRGREIGAARVNQALFFESFGGTSRYPSAKGEIVELLRNRLFSPVSEFRKVILIYQL